MLHRRTAVARGIFCRISFWAMLSANHIRRVTVGAVPHWRGISAPFTLPYQAALYGVITPLFGGWVYTAYMSIMSSEGVLSKHEVLLEERGLR